MGIQSKITRLRNNWRNLRTRQFWEDVLIYYLSKIIYPQNKGVFIIEEEWDNLIILDACRYDSFKEEFEKRNMKGKLTYKISRGSGTPEFLVENFGNRKFDDIIYITANPYVDLLLQGRFYKIISVWKDGWSEEYNTVLPSTMYEYTLDALVKYPDKRFIIHFMQPHYPFISLKVEGDTGIKHQREATLAGETVWQDITIWGLMKAGIVSFEDVIKGYKENLSLALDYVEKLVDILPGTTVITADHGEAFGEKLHSLIPIRVYGHYNGVRIEPLIKVPWLVVDEKDKILKKPEKLKIKQAIKKLNNKTK